MKKPGWLSEFVYLQTQWPAIKQISQNYSDFKSYDLAADWLDYVAAYTLTNPTPDPFRMLRTFRQSRLAYFAYHDLALAVEDHTFTMKLVSDLADLLIQKAYDLAEQEMVKKHGQVICAQNKTVQMIVIALGKLGTQELNYSSDVDLVFLYANDGQSNGNRPLEATTYFIRLGQKIIKLLDHFTTDGQVYRVDMRLRPFGSAGPLACSVSALHQYLLIEGREWERFAWMRARMICGSQADEVLVQSSILPFIYRKHLDYGVFSALAKIKIEIADNLSIGPHDLKQGAGGIRAIEFIVQSMQLVFGGRNAQLQGTSIRQQLRRLNEHGKLQSSDYEILLHAWLWLRKLENISQAVADQSTHEVPDNSCIQQVISESFGLQDWSVMRSCIAQNKEQVEQLFKELFEHSDVTPSLSTDHRQLLTRLMSEFPSSRMPVERREQVERLIQKSIPLVTEPVLDDFVGLLKKIVTRPNYLLMLQKESNIHRSVLELLSKHKYFSQILQQYPVLLEQLFEHETFQLFEHNSLWLSWQATKSDSDTEVWMEGIRYFMLVKQFNLIVAWSSGLLDAATARQQLTQLAQFILVQVVAYSWLEIKHKVADVTLQPKDLIVIAYGSAAVDQMVVSSDLDLVFVLDVDSLQNEDRLFSQKWVKRIMHHLSSQMYHGKLYELDMQLRPNGNSGALVTTRLEFEKYQMSEAWTWEHAAMVKSKAVVADAEQRLWHQQLRAKILQQKRDPIAVDEDLRQMSNKLKKSHTTDPHDEEFEILAAILKHSHDYPTLVDAINLNEARKQLVELNLLRGEFKETTKMKKDPAS